MVRDWSDGVLDIESYESLECTKSYEYLTYKKLLAHGSGQRAQGKDLVLGTRRWVLGTKIKVDKKYLYLEFSN